MTDAAAGQDVDAERNGSGVDAYALRVLEETRCLRAREDAKRRLRAEQAGEHGTRPAGTVLTDLLAEPDESASYRVDGLWPSGGRVVLAAQYKAGKSTLIGNLLRSLADGDDFLDAWTTQPAGRVALLDTELSVGRLRLWLREQGIARTDGVVTFSLRGRVASLDILDPTVRADWAAALRGHGAEVLILDCLRPVLDGLGMDENADAGRFLVAFDALCDEAGITESLLVHHAGHAGERSRGSSRLRDWPDAEWRLVRASEDPGAARYFTAYGRDVDVPEGELGYNSMNRHLARLGGNRADAAARGAKPAVIELLQQHPSGLSQRQVENSLNEPRQAVRSALSAAQRDGEVHVQAGSRGAKLHVLNPQHHVVRRSEP